MPTCNLTDEQLRAHLANHRKVQNWALGPDTVRSTMGAIGDAIEDLLARRAQDELNQLSRSLAYEYCESIINGGVNEVEVGWFDQDCVAFAAQHGVKDAIAYLTERGLIERDPTRPPSHFSIRNESEATA